MVENAAAELGDVQIREAVAVIVANRDSHAIAAAGHAGFFSHVGERAVAIVAIERVAQRLRRSVKIALAAVDEINVHPAVVIVIKERAARATGLRQVLLSGLACRVNPVRCHSTEAGTSSKV